MPFLGHDALAVEEEHLSRWNAWAGERVLGERREEALARLHVCVRDRAARLDLSNLRLTSLPPALNQLGHVRELVVSNNALTQLPTDLPPSITLLDASQNQIVHSPECLARLPNTCTVELAGNALLDEPPNCSDASWSSRAVITGPSRPSRLPDSVRLELESWAEQGGPQEMRAEAVQVLEKHFCKQTRLLRLSKLGLTTLPDCITQLTHLTGLELHGNQLSVLPRDIGKLTQLQELVLDHNNLLALP
ncbi:MAG TPA: hypothetical protein VFS42_00890, partial [Burkholderiaceae bacterium]|nr:hypothetical protein [Burkholderiaceae bacterium]